jgi:hypothetical protein
MPASCLRFTSTATCLPFASNTFTVTFDGFSIRYFIVLAPVATGLGYADKNILALTGAFAAGFTCAGS